MTDKTSRDVRLGDLSEIEATTTNEPRVGEGSVTGTRPAREPLATGRRPRVPAHSGDVPVREPREAPVAREPAALPIPSSSFNWPVLFLGIVVIVLVALVVMLISDQRKLQASLQALQAQSQEQVKTLESRVASTSTTLKSADSETQRSLNVLGGDIASLNKTLGKLAEALEQEVKARLAVDTEVKSLATELRKADQTATQADTLRDARLKAIGENLEQLNTRLKGVSESLARLERAGDLSQLRSEVAVLGASVRQLEDDFSKRLKSVEQSSGSNDAFRRQVNSTIDRLNQQVTELYQRR
jgi:septal ring factor EnvC (AmiA/AmiB activator)